MTQWPKNRKKGNENTCRCGCTTITSQAKITIFGKNFSIYMGRPSAHRYWQFPKMLFLSSEANSSAMSRGVETSRAIALFSNFSPLCITHDSAEKKSINNKISFWLCGDDDDTFRNQNFWSLSEHSAQLGRKF